MPKIRIPFTASLTPSSLFNCSPTVNFLAIKPYSLALIVLLISLNSMIFAQNVTTRSYDNSRSGANPNETILTPNNVNSAQFGKLFAINLNGEVYAQPLYVSNLAIAGGTHNVVYVATMASTVYALDADTGAQLWRRTYGTPIVTSEVQSVNYPNINTSSPIGILSTPVIDLSTNTMFFVHGNELKSGGVSTYAFCLEAIDIRTGEKVNNGPTNITGKYTSGDTTVVFDPQVQNQRASLALANGNVYIAFASHNDSGAYHGWVFAYAEANLARVAAYADTTTGTRGGIWMAGSAPAVDASGNIYVSAGNGSFGSTVSGGLQTGNSFIKLSPTLQLLDYFTPYNSQTMNDSDQDLGSAGLLLMPNPSKPSTSTYVLGGGKSGILYLTDTSNLGQFSGSQDNVTEEFQAVYGTGTSHIHGTPIYTMDPLGPTVYVWGENDVLRGYRFNSDDVLTSTPFATSPMTAPVTHASSAMPGGFLALSSNAGSNAIVWASTPYNGSACQQNVQGVLYAFNPDTLQPIWSDKDNDSRDEIGMFAKDVPPVVINGKLYAVNFGKVGTTGAAGQLVVYGLLTN
jgi:outer membrane protein assembly factor BamB